MVSRTLNFGLKGIVDKIAVFQILQRALSDPRTVELHNEGVGFPLECVHIVKFLLRFRRSSVSHETPCRAAYIEYYSASGTVKEISKGMVDVLHSNWRKIWNSCEAHRAKMQRREFTAVVANLLIANPNFPCTRPIERSQSVPRIYAGRRRKTRRSQSLNQRLNVIET